MYKDLLSPLAVIDVVQHNSNNTIKLLLREYKNITVEAADKWRSKYRHIKNYKAYVYLIHDIMIDIYIYYIGVRFTPNKNNSDLMSDLLQYQSSSSNEDFKQRVKYDFDMGYDNFKF